MAVGYTLGGAPGAPSTSVKASIIGPASDPQSGLHLYNALLNKGFWGGPVCDQTGHVVAVHDASYSFASKLGAGTTVEAIQTFLKEAIPDYKPLAGETTPVDWDKLAENLAQATVMVTAYMAPQDVGLAARVGVDFWHDKSCPVCNGRKVVDCPVRNCARGMVPTTKSVRVPTAAGGSAIESQTVRVQCDRCNGRGAVECRACFGSGKDRDVSGF